MAVFEAPDKFNRSARVLGEADAAEESAAFLIRHTCDSIGLTDLADQEVLDVGCGTKFTQALLNRHLPIKRYVGVDVYGEMIEYLQQHVTDPRFEYHHVDVRNELYNPDAPPMTENTDLGVGGETFDVIWLFSVFTHLSPDDYRKMLKLLRRYVRPDGRLFFTVFIDEFTEGGYGYMDKMKQMLAKADPEVWLAHGEEVPVRDVKPFVDLDREHPLLCAMYSREYAFELIDGTGWYPIALLPPNEHAQHQFVCAPAEVPNP